MKESTYPLERELGMRYYATDTAGIGGKLRSVPEDFIVDEIVCFAKILSPFAVTKNDVFDQPPEHGRCDFTGHSAKATKPHILGAELNIFRRFF